MLGWPGKAVRAPKDPSLTATLSLKRSWTCWLRTPEASTSLLGLIENRVKRTGCVLNQADFLGFFGH